MMPSVCGLFGLTSRAIILAWRTSSDSSSRRLAHQPEGEMLTPVRLPPGRARPAISPCPIGSPLMNTIGIVEVAFFAATAGALPPAKITSTLRPTRSAANADSRS